MRRELSCGALALQEFLYFHKNKSIIPRYDITTFQDIINEAKFYVQLIPQKTINLVKVSPCIVKVSSDHFVVVNGVSGGLVYYLDNRIPYYIPFDDFLGYWKGYVLSEKLDESAVLLKEEDCVKIMGHKKVWKEILEPIVAPIVGTLIAGPVGAMAASAGQQYGRTGKVDPIQTGMAGVGGYGMQPGIQASKAAGGSWVGQTLSGLQTAVGITPGATTKLATMGPGMGIASQGVGALGAAGTPGISQFLPGTTYMSGQGWQIPKTGTAGTTGLPGVLGSKAGQIGASLLTSGISAGTKLPELPDIESRYREVSQRILGGSPLGNLATERAMQIIQGQPLTTEDESAILGIYDDRMNEALEQVNKTYQQFGRLGSEEHKSELAKTKNYWETQKAYGLYAARKDAQAMQNQVMQAAWGYDQNQIQQMLDLAERTGDIDYLNWAVRAGDTMGVKQILDNLAKMLWPQQEFSALSLLRG